MTTSMSTATSMVNRTKDLKEPTDSACYSVRDTLELLR